MRRASRTGTWRFIAANPIFLPTCVPASGQAWARARSNGKAREATTPDVAQAGSSGWGRLAKNEDVKEWARASASIRVCLPSLAVGCVAEHRAGHDVCAGLRRSVARDGADDGEEQQVRHARTAAHCSSPGGVA